MSSPPPLSPEFRKTALAEREALIRGYTEAAESAQQHAAEAERCAAQAHRCLRAAREIGELLGIEDQLSLVEAGSELRGQRLREVAEEVLRRHFNAGDVVHYKDWAQLLLDEGYTIGGKSPNATFLTQVAASSAVTRVGSRSGRYRVREAA